MRSLIFNAGAQFTEAPYPVAQAGEALVRVVMAGICNTDIELLRGYMGFTGVPGHEFVGVVEESGNSHLLGKRVVGEINCVCGACEFCVRAMPHHCMNRSVLGILGRPGAFAEYLTIPESNLHLVPSGLPDEIAVFTEPVAAAFRILEQVDIGPGDSVVILGDGKLGHVIAQVLWTRTKRLTCVGKHARKLALLSELGIHTGMHDDTFEANADIVVEATGSPEGLQRALSLVRPEGTVILKTTVAGETALDLSVPVINEVTVVGSRCGPFAPALEALALGTAEVRPMIEAVYSFENVLAALEHAQRPGAMKVLVRISE
ncbi:MAG TPA: alcohol dehydrogenase catalytic domain-containing protein [Candidatus Hydrogenedentes bacterium]|nr:alcohol dehydrogenase catalytic domain-containing protein [Candidatus Hydrogenedentota bacterium]